MAQAAVAADLHQALDVQGNLTAKVALHPVSYTHLDVYKRQGQYSWWSYIRNARATNAGWRIDYFCVSKKLESALRGAAIHQEIFGSDHCPVELTMEFPE